MQSKTRKVQKVEVIEYNYICDACGKGSLRAATGFSKSVAQLKNGILEIEHYCPNCKGTFLLDSKYPRLDKNLISEEV